MDNVLFLFLIALLFLVFVIAGFFYEKKRTVDEKNSEAIKNLEKSFIEMVGVLKEIKGNVSGTSEAMKWEISSFAKETTEMKKQLEQVQEIVKDISSFQEIFKMPKLRGEWGEANLSHILGDFFPKELYQNQYVFSSGEKVDFVVKLPNGKLLPIDAKFFSDNFEKMKEKKSEEERLFFQKKLIQDIKLNIQKISTKYILPSENTVDFALMFIPAEAIFYEIMFNLREEDISSFARNKKVILCSPNTIYLTLKIIIDWFKETQISRKTAEILRKLSKIQQDSEKLTEDLRKLGVHLRNALSSYDSSEKRLYLFSEKIDKLLIEENFSDESIKRLKKG